MFILPVDKLLRWHRYTCSSFQLTSLPDNNINHDVHCHQPQGIVDNQLDCPACASTVACTLDSHHNVGSPVNELHHLLHVPHEAPAIQGTSGGVIGPAKLLQLHITEALDKSMASLMRLSNTILSSSCSIAHQCYKATQQICCICRQEQWFQPNARHQKCTKQRRIVPKATLT